MVQLLDVRFHPPTKLVGGGRFIDLYVVPRDCRTISNRILELDLMRQAERQVTCSNRSGRRSQTAGNRIATFAI